MHTGLVHKELLALLAKVVPGCWTVFRLVEKMSFQAWAGALASENCQASSSVASLFCLLIDHKKKSACEQLECMNNLIKIIKVIAGEKKKEQ